MDKDPNEGSQKDEVLEVMGKRPEGMTLVEIGNEMGVNWRGLIEVMGLLLEEASIWKLEDVYYLSSENE